MHWWWQLHLGMHEGLWLNHGPWGAPIYTDRFTYLAPSVRVFWSF